MELLVINPGSKKTTKKTTQKRTVQKYVYEIWFKYPGQDSEVIDTADDLENANFLLAEYQLAYRGSGSRLWVKKIKSNPLSGSTKRGSKMAIQKMRKNPSSIKKNASKAYGMTLSGLNIKRLGLDAVKGSPGPILAQLLTKKFSSNKKGFYDRDWKPENYAWYVGGAFAAGIVGNMIKRGSGAKMTEHGLVMALNKVLNEQVIDKSETLKAALDGAPRFHPDYMAAFNASPARDQYGNPIVSGFSGIAPVSPLGGTVQPVNYLGQIAPASPLGETERLNKYRKVFFQR